MYQAIAAVWKGGKILPLEPVAAEENAPLMVVVLSPRPSEQPPAEDRCAHIRALQGSMRGWTSGVDGYIAGKQADHHEFDPLERMGLATFDWIR
ncbi:MAG: hypothetical protein EPN21_09015 [Methylococcaceae bacterium]|nr:MAG: hypothetical protein EPN21_09015 [Methylococcaceae bacterium]